MARLIGSKTSKPKRNPAKVDALIKSAQYAELASTVNDRDLATAYRAKSRHFKELAADLPENAAEQSVVVKAVITKAVGFEEKAAAATEPDLRTGYLEMAAQQRRFAKELEDLGR